MGDAPIRAPAGLRRPFDGWLENSWGDIVGRGREAWLQARGWIAHHGSEVSEAGDEGDRATQRIRCHRRARAARIPALLVGCLVLAWPPAELARAQDARVNEADVGFEAPLRDYYARFSDPLTERFLRGIEHYHFSQNTFWRFYRDGHFHSARADLEYVLRNFPNHPRALHLLAFDRNLTQDPSVIIQHFEFALRTFPQHAYTHAQYGRYLLSIGKRNIGLALLDEAIRMDPDLVVALAWRAEAGKTPPGPPGARSGDSAEGREPRAGREISPKPAR